jgi:diguanylate cyclase (GGDEF)-like protein
MMLTEKACLHAAGLEQEGISFSLRKPCAPVDKGDMNETDDGSIERSVRLTALTASYQQLRFGAPIAGVAVPVVGGVLARASGASLYSLVVWGTLFAALAFVCSLVARSAIRALPWSELDLWPRRLAVMSALLGFGSGLPLVLAPSTQNGQINPQWFGCLVLGNAVIAGNSLAGYGLRRFFVLMNLPVVLLGMVACLRVGGGFGVVLCVGCAVLFAMYLGINVMAGNSFNEGVRLRAKNERLVATLEASNERLAQQAATDELTGIANRSGLLAELDRRSGESGETALLYLDLDGFKPINDRLGHRAGDEVLRTVARRLSSVVRPGDVVGRMGGDEFVLVSNLRTPDDLYALIERVNTTLSEPVELFGEMVSVSCSLGSAVHTIGEPMLSTLSDADFAMYETKRAKKRRKAEPAEPAARL